MDTTDPDSASFEYNEFAYLGENREEHALQSAPETVVERVSTRTAAGEISALRWGAGRPRLVLLHGTAQNAHTWDTVMVALGSPSAIAFDLPGHGLSAWRDDADYGPHMNAPTLIEAMEGLGIGPAAPVVLVGMSLGGLTANRIAAEAPDVVGRLVVVDITPGVTRDKARDIHDFITGPQNFESFGAILERTVEFNPTRSVSSLRRGILHNAHRNPDGTWEWNYHRAEPPMDRRVDRTELWSDIARTTAPYVLVRGGDSPVTDEADVGELLVHRPDAEVVVIKDAGHSIQGDRPVELAAVISAQLDLHHPGEGRAR